MKRTLSIKVRGFVSPVDSLIYRKEYQCHLSEQLGGRGDYVKPVRGYVDALPSQMSNRRHLSTFLDQQKRREAIIEERGGIDTPGAEAAAMAAVPSFTKRLHTHEKAVAFRAALEAGGERFGRSMGCTGSLEEMTEAYHVFMRDTYGIELDEVNHHHSAGASSATYHPDGCPSLTSSTTLGPKARLNLRDPVTKTISPEDIDSPAVQHLADLNLDAMVEEVFLRDEDVATVGLTR